MSIKVKYSNIIPKLLGVDGITLYPYILLADSKSSYVGSQYREGYSTIFRHELEHIYQVQKMGKFKFYLVYVWHYLTKGYDTHPFEKEAYDIQDELLSVDEKKIFGL